MNGFINIAAGLFYGRINALIQHADLPEDRIGCHRGSHGPAVSMVDHKQSFDPKNRHAEFQAGDYLRGHHIAGDSREKVVTNRLSKTSSTGIRESAQANTATNALVC